MKRLWVLLVVGLAVAARAQEFVNTLMPEPKELRVGGAGVVVAPGWTVSLDGAKSGLLEAAVGRMLGRVESRTGVQLARQMATGDGATVVVQAKDWTGVRPALGVDESYTLDVEGGRIRVGAATVFGAMHGLETLTQLVEARGGEFVVPGVHVVDAPRFVWRGLLLDPGRRFLPVEEVYRTLDGMAAVKLNVLHWHLTEDQGFRVESKRFPRLTGMGSGGEFYTQEQVRSVVAYAAERGIRVVPEFDMPGHSTSWMVGYPELGSAAGPYHVEQENRIFDAVMDPTRESTFRFLDAFLGEMAELFPDEYVHIGGDESNGKDWAANPAIVAYMQAHGMKDSAALQAYFNARVQVILKRHGKQMVGWDEILVPGLSREVVIQSWRGSKSLVEGARQGHRGFLSQPWYLDHMYTAGEMYLADPLPAGSTLSAAEAGLVLGGEACMWGEQASVVTADSRIWPRAAAVAERLWSPAGTRDVEDMYRRMRVMSLRLDALGLTQMSMPERGLRQMAAGDEEGLRELEVLASVLQPVDFHERFREQHTSPLTPIGRMVDFVVPDPPERQRLRLLVAAYLAATDAGVRRAKREAMEVTFRSWVGTVPALDELASRQPLVEEMAVRREELPRLGLLGLEALGLLEAGRKAGPEWVVAQRALLARAGGHVELVDFVVLDALKELVDAAERGGSGAVSPAREGAGG